MLDHDRQAAVRVTALYVYPVKSCAGTPLSVAEIGPRGIVHDREFMVVDAAGRFLTQREVPRLALIRPTFVGGTLDFAAPGMPVLEMVASDGGPRRRVVVWRDEVVAVDQGDGVAAWLTRYVGTRVRLVRLPTDSLRRVDPRFARGPADQVGFADGYPLLLISEESLSHLNAHLPHPLPMNRFRPNIVVRGGGAPYGEDAWAAVRIGELAFDVVKACARCVITTTDQATAERGAEPLRTLSTYRRVPRGVLFGQNLIHATCGRLALGDVLTVLRLATAPPM